MVEPRSALDANYEEAFQRLSRGMSTWGAMGHERRAELFRATAQTTARVADEWAQAAAVLKGQDHPSGIGEETLAGPWPLLRMLRLAAMHYAEPPSLQRQTPDPLRGGRTTVRVHPLSPLDRALLSGVWVDSWLRPEGQTGPEPQGAASRAVGLALILGAGNVTSIGPLDVLHQLQQESRVALLKLHPNFATLEELMRRALAPLIEAELVEIVQGDAESGARLCADERVEAIHLTGSVATFRRIEEHLGPQSTKVLTAELGGVTPVLVVPGQWTQAELSWQAKSVAGMAAHNSGFNCNSPQVIVTARDWSQRDEFLERVEAALAALPPRPAWYPGALERYANIMTRYPEAQVLGQGGQDVIPWTWIPDIPAVSSEWLLREEAFCGVLCEVALDFREMDKFLERLVEFTQQSVAGTLCATVLVDPRTERELGSRFWNLVQGLDYGTVAINTWAGLAFGLGSPVWGAFDAGRGPDKTSGVGWVHNAFAVQGVAKSVIRAPFRSRPTPAWFPGKKSPRGFARRLVAYERSPSWWRLPGLAWAAR